MEPGVDWYVVIVMWLKKKSTWLLVLFLVLTVGYLGIQFWTDLKGPSQPALREQKKESPQGNVQSHKSPKVVFRKEFQSDHHDDKRGEPDQKSHPINFDLAVTLLQDKLIDAGLDRALALPVMERINSFNREKHEDYNLRFPITEILGEDPEKIEQMKKIVLDAITQSFRESVERGDIKE